MRKQQPEYVGAPQKRFAWAIGFVLALTMLYLVVIKHVVGPINLIVCAACLVLLFFETAFGICIGCKVYNLFNKDQAQLCPGGVCEVEPARGAGGPGRRAPSLLAFVGRGRRMDGARAGQRSQPRRAPAARHACGAGARRRGRGRALQGA